MLFQEREILRPVKSDTVFPTARNCCQLSAKRAVLPAEAMTWRRHHKLATRFCVLYSKYNENSDLKGSEPKI